MSSSFAAARGGTPRRLPGASWSRPAPGVPRARPRSRVRAAASRRSSYRSSTPTRPSSPPGPRDRGRRRALRGGRRPQAAARALRVRGDVRVLRHQRPVVRTRRRDARGRATALLIAVEARRRYGNRRDGSPGSCSWAPMVSFAPQDGQAANFEVFMLPSMTAAILFAPRPRTRVGAMVAPRRWRSRPGRRRSSPSCYLLARARGSGESASRRRLHRADRAGALQDRACAALLLGRARQRLVPGNRLVVGARDRHVRLDDARLVRLQPAAAVEGASGLQSAAWRPRRPARHRPVAVAAVGPGLGGDRLALLRSLLHAAGAATLPSAALHSRSRRSGTCHRRTRGVQRGAVLQRRLLHAAVRRRARVREGECVPRRERPDDAILVWGSMPEIYWASGLRPATLHHHEHVPGEQPPRPDTHHGARGRQRPPDVGSLLR